MHSQRTRSEQRFQTNLLTIERDFQDSLSSLKLAEHHVLFIDGIDIRPESIPYKDYLDCVKGLANAAWSLNNDFFPSIRDSHGRLRVVLLLRPDIFNSLGLQNRNTKLRDNSLVLDWRTTYPEHRKSDLFALADRMFSVQQNPHPPLGAAWDHYFPFNASSVISEQRDLTSFVVFLRYSFYRPRDILTILDILNDQRQPYKATFEYGDLFTPDFRRAYGDYMLGEIKDSLSFYYEEAEFLIFMKFFEFLSGHQKFSYSQFCDAHTGLEQFQYRQQKSLPDFMKTPEEFLQFLYDLNVIGFFEQAGDETFIRWCFRERGPNNLSPQVKTDTEYEIHYALANVLNTGKELRPKRSISGPSSTAGTGKIKWFDRTKGYGFVIKPDLPIDVFFHKSDFVGNVDDIRDGASVDFKLEKDLNGSRLIARDVKLKRS